MRLEDTDEASFREVSISVGRVATDAIRTCAGDPVIRDRRPRVVVPAPLRAACQTRATWSLTLSRRTLIRPPSFPTAPTKFPNRPAEEIPTTAQ